MSNNLNPPTDPNDVLALMSMPFPVERTMANWRQAVAQVYEGVNIRFMIEGKTVIALIPSQNFLRVGSWESEKYWMIVKPKS